MLASPASPAADRLDLHTTVDLLHGALVHSSISCTSLEERSDEHTTSYSTCTIKLQQMADDWDFELIVDTRSRDSVLSSILDRVRCTIIAQLAVASSSQGLAQLASQLALAQL